MDKTTKGLKKMYKLTYEELPSKARGGIQLIDEEEDGCFK